MRGGTTVVLGWFICMHAEVLKIVLKLLKILNQHHKLGVVNKWIPILLILENHFMSLAFRLRDLELARALSHASRAHELVNDYEA